MEKAWFKLSVHPNYPSADLKIHLNHGQMHTITHWKCRIFIDQSILSILLCIKCVFVWFKGTVRRFLENHGNSIEAVVFAVSETVEVCTTAHLFLNSNSKTVWFLFQTGKGIHTFIVSILRVFIFLRGLPRADGSDWSKSFSPTPLQETDWIREEVDHWL